MTNNVEKFEFLLRQKPSCTQSPIKSILGAAKYKDLRAKYKLELGIDLLDDRCPNSFNCITSGNGCIGRPFPIDPDIRQSLLSINVETTTDTFKGRAVYIAKSIVTCSECPLFNECQSTCVTQESYLKRTIQPDFSPKGPMLVNIDKYEQGIYGSNIDLTSEYNLDYDGSWKTESLPLDCLSDRQREIIDMNLYQGLDQVTIAHRLNIQQHTVSKHLSSSISKLKEVGKARKVIKSSDSTPSIVIDFYVNNKTHEEIAYVNDISRSYVTKIINKWKENNNM